VYSRKRESTKARETRRKSAGNHVIRKAGWKQYPGCKPAVAFSDRATAPAPAAQEAGDLSLAVSSLRRLLAHTHKVVFCGRQSRSLRLSLEHHRLRCRRRARAESLISCSPSKKPKKAHKNQKTSQKAYKNHRARSTAAADRSSSRTTTLATSSLSNHHRHHHHQIHPLPWLNNLSPRRPPLLRPLPPPPPMPLRLRLLLP